MKQICFGILSKFCVFILIGLSDLNKSFVYGQNLNTLSASSTTPSTYDVSTLSYSNNESSITSDLTSTIEPSHTGDAISSDIAERFDSEDVSTEPSKDIKSVQSNDFKSTQSDIPIESSDDDLQVRFLRSNDSSSPEPTINTLLDQDDTKFTTETILLDTQKPPIIQSRIFEDETTVTNNPKDKNTPNELSEAASNFSRTPVDDDSSTRGRRFLFPTATNTRYQTIHSTNNLVDVLSSRLIELYIANVHSTEGLPSPEVLSVLLSPLHVIIEQAVNLLGLSNCKLMCDNNPQPIYIHKPVYEQEPINVGDLKQSRIIEIFSKSNYHQQASATKTPWLDILRVISPIDCYKPDKNNMQLEEFVNMLLSKYGYLNRPRPVIMPNRVPIPLHPTSVRIKPPVFEDVPNYPLPRPRLPLPQKQSPLPLWLSIKSKIPMVPYYPQPKWPQFQGRQPFQIPQEQPRQYIGIRPEIPIPNINIVPWRERPTGKQVQPPLISLPQLQDQNQLSPLLNIWYIIEKLKTKGQTLKPKLPEFIKPKIPLPVLPILPKLKPLLNITFSWFDKPKRKLSVPVPFIPKFKPIITQANKSPMPGPFVPVLPPIRFPYVPKKSSKITLPTLPKLNLPKRPLPNPQLILELKNKPKYPLPSLILPRLPRPISPQPSYYKPNPILDKIYTVLGLLKANKPCLVKKVPIKPHYPMPNLTLPLPPLVKPILNPPIFYETIRPKPLPKIMNLEQLKIPKVPSITLQLPKLILPSTNAPRYPKPNINPIPVLELPRPPSFKPKPSVISQFEKPNFFKELLLNKQHLIPLFAKFIPTPQIHINIPNINFKPISKNSNLPPLNQFKEPLFDLFPGFKHMLTKWNQIKMPSPYLPPLNQPQVSEVPKFPQVPQINIPKMHVVSKVIPKINVPPTIQIPKYYELPCKNRTPAHILFPSLKKQPMSGRTSGYRPYSTISSSGLLSYQSINIGLKPTIPIPRKPVQPIPGREQDKQIMNHQIQQPIVFQQPIFTPTHIPMKVHPGNTHPIVLVSKPGVSTTTVDKDGNLIGKLKINANGKPCIELDHPALQMIAQHEKASLHGGKKQGWFELWYNDGTGPEKQRWKLVWNDKEIQDYLHRKNH